MNLRRKLSSHPFLKQLQTHPNFQRIAANIGWLFFDRILRMGVGLSVGVWVARYLGVEQFGTLNYATALAAFFTILAALGLPSPIIRSLTHDPDRKDEILGTAFWLQLGGGVITVFLAILTIMLLRPHDSIALSLVALLTAVGVLQAFDTIDLWFQSQVQSKYKVLAKNTAFLMIAALKLWLIHLHAPLITFAVVTLLEAAIGAAGLWYFYHAQGHSVWAWKWNYGLAKLLLIESYPLILASVTIIVYMKIDQIMLGAMLGDQAVGIYSSATRISEVWHFIPLAIASSTSPSIYAAKKEGDDTVYYNRISQMLRWLALIALMITVPMVLLANVTVITLYGSEYALAGPILVIHIWASFFVFMGVGTSSWFVAEGLSHLMFRMTLLGAFINIGLNFMLIPSFGGVGAAIATIISHAFATTFGNVFDRRTRKIFALQMRSLLPIH